VDGSEFEDSTLLDRLVSVKNILIGELPGYKDVEWMI